MTRLAAVALTVSFGLACGSSKAGVEGWELLGTRTVSSAVDFDVLVVQPPGSFRDLKLIVRGSPLRLYGVNVEPASAAGGGSELRVGDVVPAGGEVELIEGVEPQLVERVVLRYEPASLFGAAPSVSLYGRR